MLYDKLTLQYEKYPQLAVASSVTELVKKCDVIFISVKPDKVAEVLAECHAALGDNGIQTKLFISIAAGISIKYLTGILGENAAVVRVMPNTPMLVGCGVCALSRGKNVTDNQYCFARTVFSSAGEIIELDEDKMNAVISLTSSSPAYLFELADAMSNAAVIQGFDKAESVRLCAAVFAGAAKMLLESGKTPAELSRMVTSPGGTTRAALDVFEASGFASMIRDAMLACTKRAQELSK
ncbi:Pyrroline-5-carboxylate reductase [bioreactor metagenome]|uniref:Pyrroline-5-carboxylate reductase n=1 Tax=bioreactor metagenome TaxID=1076179 RepID=A0A645FEV5_9ZZZZ